jgi:hypothetical protein
MQVAVLFTLSTALGVTELKPHDSEITAKQAPLSDSVVHHYSSYLARERHSVNYYMDGGWSQLHDGM